MQIDNSKAQCFRFCPDKYRERYICGIEKAPSADENDSLAFGSRMHELLEEHNLALKGTPRVERYLPSASEATELEAQAMFARYCSQYPVEPFTVVDVEQVFSIPLVGTEHIYVGKLDGVIRYTQPPFTGQLAVLEHKTEKRSSRRNTPESWAAKAQVALYKYAVETLYKEPVAHILLDVLRRQSPKGQEPPILYRDILERSEAQISAALNDLLYVADQIEWLNAHYDPDQWPQTTDNCCVNGWKCDYFGLHIGKVDRDMLIKIQYKQAESYLPGI